MPERIARLEERQLALDEEREQMMANLSVRIDKAHETATEAKEIATQVASSMEAMPGKIIEAMESRRKSTRLEVKEWIMLALVLLSPFAASWANDIMHPTKPTVQIMDSRTGR